MSDGGGRYDRLLALNTATRLRRALRAGSLPLPAQPSAEPPRDGDQRVLKESLDIVAPAAADLVSHFYAVLFHGRPHLRDLFPVAMDVQRDRLLHALLTVVGQLHEPGFLVPLLQQLGRDHRKFGVRPVHYGAVGAALISALQRYSGSSWTAEYEEVWLRAYLFAAEVMTTAAAAAEPSPPYWHATVVAHEVRLDDLAVLTVRPDTPYPFIAGQFATLESPRRPRTWRPYSMANAPALDGLLEFHVRMVGAGWVSRALVRQTAVGDTLRLGPPIGSLTLEAATPDRPLLLVAGGTGLAPMKALLAGLADDRQVTLLLATRGPADLYDLAAIADLVTRRPAVTLVVALDQEGYVEPPPPVFRGRAHEVLPELGDDLAEREIFLAGPPAMLHACAGVLAELGAHHVHVDPTL